MYRSDWIWVFVPLLIVFDFAPEAGGPRMYIANEVADEVMQDSKYDSVKAPLQKDFEAIPELTGEQFENKPLSQKDNSGPPFADMLHRPRLHAPRVFADSKRAALSILRLSYNFFGIISQFFLFLRGILSACLKNYSTANTKGLTI